jgi:hypothetical protein
MQFETPLTEDISLICGTPVMAIDVPSAAAINVAVMSEIKSAIGLSPGVRGSNVGGWQSPHDFWSWVGPGAIGVRGALQRAVNTICAIGSDQPDPMKVDIQYQAKAWANVNGPGHYNVRHCNAQYDWQLFYFVGAADLSGQPAPIGRLEIHDPRRMTDISPLRRFGFAGSMLIEPAPGKLVLIPAWMEHTLHPFFQPGELVWVSALAKMTGGRHAGLRPAS